MSFSYDKIKQFKAGDRYCECQYGQNLWFVVKEDAVEKLNGDDWQVRFVGITDAGDEIDYLVTKGFEHYGPRIYDAAQYINRDEIKAIINEARNATE